MVKKILIVDDSALMRRAESDIINADDHLTVEDVARNGEEALRKIEAGGAYDLIITDLNMPKMGGVALLKEMERLRNRTPVLVVSSIADESASETMEALALGAFDFIKKPAGSMGQGFVEFQYDILTRAYLACGLHHPKEKVKPQREEPVSTPAVEPAKSAKPAEPVAPRKPAIRSGNGRLVVIASSTGGPKALQSVVPYFPKDFPYPIVIVQHMPAGFTSSLASRLNEMSQLRVKEAEDGEKLRKGYIYIAQGGKQCEVVEPQPGNFVLSVNDKPARGGLRPCADIFFESLIETSLDNFVCGVLTGMGSDGCKGIQLVKKHKRARVVAQNEATCVVYGMPRAVKEAGVVNDVVPLSEVANSMIKQLGV